MVTVNYRYAPRALRYAFVAVTSHGHVLNKRVDEVSEEENK